ncbi:hypothetical protein D3C73_1513070 [compost metagenome]
MLRLQDALKQRRLRRIEELADSAPYEEHEEHQRHPAHYHSTQKADGQPCADPVAVRADQLAVHPVSQHADNEENS